MLTIALGLLGEASSVAAFVLPLVGFVCTAVCLGCCNLMLAVFARAAAPQALGSLTGLTRCMFTLGLCVLPVLLGPMLSAGGLRVPCFLVSALFLLQAAALQVAKRSPASGGGRSVSGSGGDSGGGGGGGGADRHEPSSPGAKSDNGGCLGGKSDNLPR